MVHQAITDGNCQGCHNPHQADNEKFLNTTRTSSLCRSCHREQRSEARLDHVHSPFKEDCFKCHQPHSSKEAHLLEYKPKELCTSCHADFVANMHQMPLLHEAVNEQESCLNCHSPHASKQAKMVKGVERELCLNCHSAVIESENRNIKNIGELLAEGNHVHGAIEQNGCTVCHNPHASEKHTLLSGIFPEENYTPADTSNFELCFKCHNKELFQQPLSTTATNFRNDDQNLHYTHINGNKGRSCTLCHNVHGSKSDHLIDEKTAFGNWDMPVKYELMENGGSCSPGCHEKRTYERIVIMDTVNIEK
jgi:predicted CXXCH cytochrome family protein